MRNGLTAVNSPAFHFRHTRGLAWPTVYLLAVSFPLVACEGILGPEPVDIELLGVPAALEAGRTMPVRAVVRDADGREITDADVQWLSSDPTSAIVENDVLHALDAGVVDLVARVGFSSATARVRVRFPGLHAGVLGVRVQGTDQRHLSTGNAFLREPMAWESLGGTATSRPVETHVFSASGLSGVVVPGDYYGLFAELFPADTVLWLALQSAPETGRTTYSTLVPQVRPDGTLVPYITDRAMLRVRDPQVPDRMVAYVAVDRIVVDIVDYRAPATGDLSGDGLVHGSVWFEAAGLVLEDEPTGNPKVIGAVGGSTTQVYGEFDLPLHAWPLGIVRSTWHGGRFDSDTNLSTLEPAWPSWGESWQIRWVSAIDRGPSLVDNLAVRLQLSPGDTELRHLDPVALKGGPHGSWVWGSIDVGNAGTIVNEALLFSREGRMSIASFDPPSPTSLGQLTGHLAATLERYDPEGVAEGETVELVAEVFAPLVPPEAARIP